MRGKGKYRFSLQFGADSPKHVRIGELLERCGNRKSLLIIEALDEYLRSHPDAEIQGALSIKRGEADGEELKQMIRSVVEDQIAEIWKNGSRHELPFDAGVTGENDLSQMLDNINLFL